MISRFFFTRETISWGLGWLSDPDEFDPGGTGIFETSSGIRITIDGTAGMRHGVWVELIGDAGIIKLIDSGFDVQIWTPDEREHWREFGMMSLRHIPQNFRIGSPFLNALDDMMGCIENEAISKSSGQDGRAAFEMITAVHLSHQNQKQVIQFPLNERSYEIPSN